MGAEGGKGKPVAEGRKGAPLLASRPSLSFLGPPAMLVVFVVLAAVLLLAVRENEVGMLPPPRATPERVAAVAPPPTATAQQTRVADQATKIPTAQVKEPGVELRVETLEETWISVSADGGDSVAMLLKPGDQRRWRALKGFTLTVGNAGGIRVLIDGSEIPPLGSSGEVLRNLDLPADWRTD